MRILFAIYKISIKHKSSIIKKNNYKTSFEELKEDEESYWDQNPIINSLTLELIDFLMKISFKHYPNSIYVSQWYQLFQKFVLDDSTPNNLNVDKLLIQLFQETELTVSSKRDYEDILREINFEKFNASALNLLIAFCSHNNYRTKGEVEIIIDFLLENITIREKVFRPFTFSDETKNILLNVIL